MNKVLIYGGGIVAAGLVVAYVKKLGPFAPEETQIDPSQKITGGAGLTPEDLVALGAPPPAPPTSGEGGDIYRLGINDYMKRSWRPGGAGVRSDLAVALVEGGRGVDNVSAGSTNSKTASASLASNYAGAAKNGNGEKIRYSAARGFTVNEFQAAVYAPDAGRLWGLVQGYVETSDDKTRDVDVFVTAGAAQSIDANGAVYGLGQVYAWDPVANAWVDPGKLRFKGNAARQIYRNGSPWLETNNSSEEGLVAERNPIGKGRSTQPVYRVYGYKDAEGKRLGENQLVRLANESRTKAKPV
jgi:hypothetical protein